MKSMKGLDNKTFGQTMNGALSAATIKASVAVEAYKYFIKLFNQDTSGENDRNSFSKVFEYSRNSEGIFDAPDPILSLLRDIDRTESPFSDNCEKVRLHVGLYMRLAKTDLPAAESDVAARWVVNLGQPDTLRMVGSNHSWRVHFGPNNYRFLGAIQHANYAIDSPGGKLIRMPTLHTMLTDGARNDKTKPKIRRYRRVTILVDAIGDTEIEDEELGNMLQQTAKVRDNAFNGKHSDGDLKKAAMLAKIAGERFAKETGAGDDPEQNELLRNMQKAFSDVEDEARPTEHSADEEQPIEHSAYEEQPIEHSEDKARPTEHSADE